MPAVLSRITGLALRYPWRVALTVVTSLFATIANLALPRLFGRSIDEAHHLLAKGSAGSAAATHTLLIIALTVIVATGARGFLTMAAGFQGEYLSQKVGLDLRLRFFQQLQRLSFGFHDRVHSGDLITRGMLDLEGARSFIQQALAPSLSLVLQLGFSAYMMIAIDPWMALIGLSFVPVASFALGRMGFLLRVAWLRVQQFQSQLTLIMEENLQGIRVVRAFAGRAFEMAKFDAAAKSVLAVQYERLTLRFKGLAGMQLSYYAALGALLWYGGDQVLAGRMSVGKLTEFSIYMTFLQAPIRQIAMIFSTAARATSSGARLFEVLDLEPEVADAPNAGALSAGDGVLRFEGVGFAYDPIKPVLHDITFEVGPGRTLGIVGPPGSGKSTIANLIPRFYDVTQGRITIGGTDIRTVTLSSLREHVGLVQQESFLFDATVGHNVAYADPWADDERIEAAARTAQIHDHVSRLPQRYETRVGERGVAFSGGQRQRMSIARGVVPGPGIVIFDDSTAAIDAVTERKVREGLAAATRAKTTVIIAHRLSSLMHADEIIVLSHGRIAERGDHASLLAAGGAYAELFELQSRAASGALEPAA